MTDSNMPPLHVFVWEISMSLLTRHELASDRDAIRIVNQTAFGGDTEAKLVDELRAGGFVCVSLVANIDGQVVGHILFSRVKISTATGNAEAISLAPMAMLPRYQRQRIGSKLLSVGLVACRAHGYRIEVVSGHPKFYRRRCGSSSKLAVPLESPIGSGGAWMSLGLVPQALKDLEGRVEYSSPFCLFERGDCLEGHRQNAVCEGFRILGPAAQDLRADATASLTVPCQGFPWPGRIFVSPSSISFSSDLRDCLSSPFNNR